MGLSKAGATGRYRAPPLRAGKVFLYNDGDGRNGRAVAFLMKNDVHAPTGEKDIRTFFYDGRLRIFPRICLEQEGKKIKKTMKLLNQINVKISKEDK